MTQIYKNKKVENWISKIVDLFCLEDNPPNVELKQWHNQKGYYRYKDHTILIGCKKGIRLTTLVHEMLHATGHSHTWEINGWANYRSNCKMDNYSPLIVKDLTGKKELVL